MAPTCDVPLRRLMGYVQTLLNSSSKPRIHCVIQMRRFGPFVAGKLQFSAHLPVWEALHESHIHYLGVIEGRRSQVS
jgi:hypothetical protein